MRPAGQPNYEGPLEGFKRTAEAHKKKKKREGELVLKKHKKKRKKLKKRMSGLVKKGLCL